MSEQKPLDRRSALKLLLGIPILAGSVGGMLSGGLGANPTGGNGGVDDKKLKITLSDTTPDFLNPKLNVDTDYLSEIIQNPSANEILKLGFANPILNEILIQRALASNIAIRTRVSGDSQDRFRVFADGRIFLGLGGFSAPTHFASVTGTGFKIGDGQAVELDLIKFAPLFNLTTYLSNDLGKRWTDVSTDQISLGNNTTDLLTEAVGNGSIWFRSDVGKYKGRANATNLYLSYESARILARRFGSVTMTNIGTSYKDVYNATAFDEEHASVVDFTGLSEIRLIFIWDYVGVGTQQVRIVDRDNNTNVLVEIAGFTIDQDPGDSGWIAIPSAFLNTTKKLEWQGKSTTTTDDPIAKGWQLYAR